MIGDLLTEWRIHLNERLNNPILGPFTAGWLACNWRLVAVLMASEKPIEQRIEFIDHHYLGISNLLIFPAIFALIFAIGMPWLTLGMQHLQGGAIRRRRMAKLSQDTEYLQASIHRAEAQATLNGILAQDEITRRQKEELDTRSAELKRQQEAAASQLELMEAELKQQREEYEARSDKNNEAAQAQREELERLRKALAEQQAAASTTRSAAQRELEKRQKELDRRLNTQSHSRVPDEELIGIVTSGPFRLYHNPSVGPERSKTVAFDKSGKVSTGGNKNENLWRIKDGQLELLQSDGRVHSRFHYVPESRIFLLTGDSDLKSARGQYIIPEMN